MALLFLAVTTVEPRGAAAQTAGDPLNVGLTVTGTAETNREKDDTSFVIAMSGTRVFLFVRNDFAFSPKPNATLTYQWAQTLSRPVRVTVQIGEPRGRPADSLKDFNEMLACFSEPRESKGIEALFSLRCTAFDDARQPKENGTPTVEVVVFFTVPIGSAGDAYLGKRRPENTILYVRLKPE